MLDKKNLSDYDKPLIESPQESYTLPSCMYADNEVYEKEKE